MNRKKARLDCRAYSPWLAGGYMLIVWRKSLQRFFCGGSLISWRLRPAPAASHRERSNEESVILILGTAGTANKGPTGRYDEYTHGGMVTGTGSSGSVGG